LRKNLAPFTRNILLENIMLSKSLFYINFTSKKAGENIELTSKISLVEKEKSTDIAKIITNKSFKDIKLE
jgi:hypothetical protein